MIDDLPTEPAYEADSPFRQECEISHKAQDGSQGCAQGSARGSTQNPATSRRCSGGFERRIRATTCSRCC